MVELGAHATLAVFANAFLEEVCFALEADGSHEVERVFCTVGLGLAERHKKAVSAEFNILAHEGRIHANQPRGKRVTDKLVLDLHGIADDRANSERCGRA